MKDMVLNVFGRGRRWRLAGLAGGLALAAGWWFLLPRPLFDVPYSTVVLDRDGGVMGALVADDGQFRFREGGRLPDKYVAAVLAFEDGRFALHGGVDWLALGRALVQNVRAGKVVSGGSTLSMQVVRLSRRNPPRTLGEKVREIFLTLRLEQGFSKEEILRMYASHAPFGGNVVGLRAAALKYFDREPGQLSWAEAALLAVLPNAPSLIFPGRNNSVLKEKRDGLLRRLADRGCLSDEDFLLAQAEPLPVRAQEVECVTPHLLALAGQERRGEVCRTGIDEGLQRRVAEVVDRHCGVLRHNYIFNAAVLVGDVRTGEVRAYVGNSRALPGSRGNEVDVVRAVRSSGSILKPALYALAQQHGFILPGTLLADVPSRFGGYAPSNFNRDFQGAAPASAALAQSLNIPFVRLLKEYGYGRFYGDLKELGIRSLNREADHYGLSLILGGGEVSLWDVCNMYGGMASVMRHYGEEDGQYYEGEYGRLRVWTDGGDGGQVACRAADVPLRASAVWLTLGALQEVVRPDMEAGWRNFASGMSLSWKTGTSFGFRDAWAVGVNRDYVVGVWVGNADGEGRPGLVGTRAAAPILFEVAALLPSSGGFEEPLEEMARVAVCRRSGFRVSSFCEERDTVSVCEAGVRTGVCPFHRLVSLDESGRWQVGSDCERVYRMRMEPWFVLPPVQEWYYCRTHADYRKLPPFREGCRGEAADVMEMVYPQPGARVFIPRGFGGKLERVVLEAAHRLPSAVVYWDVDGEYLGQTQELHQMEVLLPEGRHVLVLTDDAGNVLRQVFGVVGKDTGAAASSAWVRR